MVADVVPGQKHLLGSRFIDSRYRFIKIAISNSLPGRFPCSDNGLKSNTHSIASSIRDWEMKPAANGMNRFIGQLTYHFQYYFYGGMSAAGKHNSPLHLIRAINACSSVNPRKNRPRANGPVVAIPEGKTSGFFIICTSNPGA